MKTYLVDLPNPHATEPDSEYINVMQFSNLDDALIWLRETHGMPRDVAQWFVSDSED